MGDGHLVSTSAYRVMLELFERSRDLYSARHIAEPGFTFDRAHNAMTRKSALECERIDYVFGLDYAPALLDESQPAVMELLECLEASVEVCRDQGRELSDHFAVAVTLVPV